jgi:hypothetical protein
MQIDYDYYLGRLPRNGTEDEARAGLSAVARFGCTREHARDKLLRIAAFGSAGKHGAILLLSGEGPPA